MANNNIKEARRAVADYTLTNLRRAVIVSDAVERQLNSSHAKPTASRISTAPSPSPRTNTAERNTDINEDEFIDQFEPIHAGHE